MSVKTDTIAEHAHLGGWMDSSFSAREWKAVETGNTESISLIARAGVQLDCMQRIKYWFYRRLYAPLASVWEDPKHKDDPPQSDVI